jgi:GT2 family glycosyltransferase
MGRGLLSGEEVDLVLRLATHGAVRYLPQAWLWHHIESHRATRRWLLRRYLAQGRTSALMKTPVTPGTPVPTLQPRRPKLRLPRLTRRGVRLFLYLTVSRLGSHAARVTRRGTS